MNGATAASGESGRRRDGHGFGAGTDVVSQVHRPVNAEEDGTWPGPVFGDDPLIALRWSCRAHHRDPAPFLAFRCGRVAGGANGVPQLPSPPVAEGVVIRPERDADHPVIAEVVRAAFVGHPDEVASFVERIRASEQFIPELALVAEDSSGVIAHVMLSWVGVEGGSRTRILNLTPMSVRPDRQRIGVGARLIRDALGRAEEAGEPAVMVEGIPAYYPRFGFEQASALGFISPHPKIPDDAFMVKRLPGYSPDLAGRIVYPAAFDALGY